MNETEVNPNTARGPQRASRPILADLRARIKEKEIEVGTQLDDFIVDYFINEVNETKIDAVHQAYAGGRQSVAVAMKGERKAPGRKRTRPCAISISYSTLAGLNS